MQKILFIIMIFFVNGLVGCASIQTTNDNSTKKVEMVKESMDKNLDQIIVEDISSNLVIQNGDKYKVYYQGNEKDKPDIQVSDSKLEIKNRRNFSFNFHTQKISTIIIELPNIALSKIKISSSNGNVKIEKLKVRKGSISTSNGDITINNLKVFHGFTLSSSNGNVKVRQSNAAGYDLSAANGEVKFNGRYEADELKINTPTPNVLKVENSNGDIELN